MTLQEIITTYKEKNHLTDMELAERAGVTRTTVNRWVHGSIKRVSGETMKKISTLVGYDIEPILKGKDITVKLPVLGYVKAGYDLFAEENYLGEEEASLKEANIGSYWLKVSGDSMQGIGILDGSLVLVRQCSSVPSGKIAVILIGDEVTVKRVIQKRDMLILEAANPSVPARYFSKKEVKQLPVTVLGQVISCKTYF